MQKDQLYRALDVSVQSMLSGIETEQLLDLYPKWKNDLSPLIRSAYLAYQLGASASCPQDKLEVERQKFLQQSQSMVPGTRSTFRSVQKSISRILTILFIITVLLFAGALFLSRSALPGNILYPMKETGRELRLFFIRDSYDYIQTSLLMDKKRLEEIEQARAKKRQAPVSLGGRINQSEDGEWQIDTLELISNSETQLVGDIWPGFYVHVDGVLLTDGVILAKRIQSQQFLIRGTVEMLTPERMVVDGIEILLTPDTLVQGQVQVDARADVLTLLSDEGIYRARLIKITSSKQSNP